MLATRYPLLATSVQQSNVSLRQIAEDFIEAGAGFARSELRGRLVRDHFSLSDDDDAIADRIDLLEDVRREDDGFLDRHALDERSHFILLVGIEAVGRLVEHQCGGIVQERLGETDALLEALREGFDRL